MLDKIKLRWKSPGGYKEVLWVAVPLILSSSAHTVQMFIDRVFLSWYDLDAMPAAMQAGVTNFTFVSFFMGIVGYVSTFVAQYSGAQRDRRVGPAVWQGVYLAILFGIILLVFLLMVAEHIFVWLDHAPEIRNYEIIYFKIMCLGSPSILLSVALSCFYTGRGKTWTVLFVNAFGSIINIVLDYILIFGKFNFPQMGIKGAAIATVIASYTVTIIFAFLFLQSKYEESFVNYSGNGLKFRLIKRILRFGFPAGLQFFLDMISFTLFVGFIGRIDKIAQTASSMTFSINMLAFLPMIGMGNAVGILVGKALGANKIELAQKSTYSAFHLCFLYMSIVAGLFLTVPDILLGAFKPAQNSQEFIAVTEIASRLLIFLAIFCLFDTGNIIFSAALKGAGDTKFVMYMSVTLHWLLLVLPPYVLVTLQVKNSLYLCWISAAFFVGILAICYYWRFLGGKWKQMRVIEKPPTVVQFPAVPDTQTAEMDY